MPPDDPRDPADSTETSTESEDSIQTEERKAVTLDDAESKESLRSRETVVIDRLVAPEQDDEDGEHDEDDHVTTAEAATVIEIQQTVVVNVSPGDRKTIA